MKLPPRDLPLGQDVAYPTAYDPTLLFPIARAEARRQIGIQSGTLPFMGWDLWNAYEMSWLTPQGMPQVAILRLKVDCQSPNIIESKSLKLYLNSFNQAAFASTERMLDTLRTDLSHAAGTQVDIELILPKDFTALHIKEFDGLDLDSQSLTIDCYEPNANLLCLTPHPSGTPRIVHESLFLDCSSLTVR